MFFPRVLTASKCSLRPPPWPSAPSRRWRRGDLFDAQRNYALARYEEVLTILTLEQAAGTLNTAEVTRVSAWLE